jgi:hypothetical protein
MSKTTGKGKLQIVRRACYVPDSQRNLSPRFLTYVEGERRNFAGWIARRRG